MRYENKLNVLKVINQVGALWALVYCSYSELTLSLFCFLFFQIVGANIAMHRYLGHASFKTHFALDAVLVTSANLLCFGDTITFAAMHRLHHKNSDTDIDPHSPRTVGFYNTCLGYWRHSKNLLFYAKDLSKQPLHRFFRKYYFTIISSVYLVVFILGGLKLVCLMLALPLNLVFWTSIGLTYICHKYGYKNSQTDDHSLNNRMIHILTLGDGMHNNHHRNPSRIYQGNDWTELDLTGLILNAALKFSLIKKRSENA